MDAADPEGGSLGVERELDALAVLEDDLDASSLPDDLHVDVRELADGDEAVRDVGDKGDLVVGHDAMLGLNPDLATAASTGRCHRSDPAVLERNTNGSSEHQFKSARISS